MWLERDDITDYKVNRKCFVLSRRPSHYWWELLLLKSCLLGLENLKAGVCTVSKLEIMFTISTFSWTVWLDKRRVVSPKAPTTAKEKWLVTSEGDRVMFHNAREVSDDARVVLAAPWWPSTATHSHSTLPSPWMTLAYVSQKLMLEQFFFLALPLCWWKHFSNKKGFAPCSMLFLHGFNEKKPRLLSVVTKLNCPAIQNPKRYRRALSRWADRYQRGRGQIFGESDSCHKMGFTAPNRWEVMNK